MAVETLEGQTKTISASKLMGRDVSGPSLGKVGGGPYGGTSATGKLAGIVRSNKKSIAVNAEKITRLKKISELQSKKISGDDIGSKLPTEETAILDSLDNILALIRNEQKEKDKLLDAERKRRENKKRSKKESGLEKVGKSIKEKGKKVIDSIKSPFEKLIDALKTLLFGKIVIDLFGWFQDPDNEKKVQTIFRFLKDWWPTLLTGLILFGATLLGPTGLVIAGVALVVGFLPQIIDGIKQLFGFKDEIETDADDANKELAAQEKEVGELKPETPETLNPAQQTGDKLASAPEPQTKEPPVQMKEGGKVPGSGPNKDTIPAMLSPGEFVMSRGAVNKFGSDTMASMNAMGGGTNRPSIVNNVVYANTGGQMPGAKGSDEKTDRPKSTNMASSMMSGSTTNATTPKNSRAWWDFLGWAGTGNESTSKSSAGASGVYAPVLDLIAKYEAGAGGWESMYPGTTLPGATKMTISQVAANATGAVGMYQNMPEFLIGRAKAVGLDPNTALYNEENQRKIANYLIGKGQANVTVDMMKNQPDEAMIRLAKVWAAIPVPRAMQGHTKKLQKGESYYAGVGSNKAHITPDMMYKAMSRVTGKPVDYTKIESSSTLTGVSSPISSSTSGATSSGPNILEMVRNEAFGSSASTPKMTASNPRPAVKPPVRKSGTSTEALIQAQEAQQTAQQESASSGGGTDVPAFSATAFRSGHKIKTLGIVA